MYWKRELLNFSEPSLWFSVVGVYEVGVHIADVSFFVTPENALDDVAAARATSVYLVQKVRRIF